MGCGGSTKVEKTLVSKKKNPSFVDSLQAYKRDDKREDLKKLVVFKNESMITY